MKPFPLVNATPYPWPFDGAATPANTALVIIDMQFDFAQLVAHAARTRPLSAGTIVGSGTIANEDTSLGASCFAEQRTVETLRDGKPSTPFMSFGDTVRIEMLDREGNSIFGAIEQVIERQSPP